MTPTPLRKNEYLDRNVVMNGAFDIMQRSSSFVASSSNVKVLDRWYAIFQGGSANVTRELDAPPTSKSIYSMRVESTTSSNPGTSEFRGIWQRIEGQFFRHLHGKTASVTFWAKTNKANAKFSVSLASNNTFDAVLYKHFQFAQVDTWEKFHIIIPNIKSGGGSGWAQDNNVGAQLIWNFGVGSNFIGAEGQWSLGQSVAQDGSMTNLGSSAGEYFQIADVTMTEGSKKVEEFFYAGRNVVEELALCQRYFEKSYSQDTPPGSSSSYGICQAQSIDSNRQTFDIPYKVAKRSTIPTPTLYSYNGTANRVNQYNSLGTDLTYTVSAVRASQNSIHSWAYLDVGVSSLSGVLFHWTVDAEM